MTRAPRHLPLLLALAFVLLAPRVAEPGDKRKKPKARPDATQAADRDTDRKDAKDAKDREAKDREQKKDERPGSARPDRADEDGEAKKDEKARDPDARKDKRTDIRLKHTARKIRKMLLRTLRADKRLEIRRRVRDRVRQRIRDRGAWALRWLVDGTGE